jgi:hypothetical protein
MLENQIDQWERSETLRNDLKVRQQQEERRAGVGRDLLACVRDQSRLPLREIIRVVWACRSQG